MKKILSILLCAAVCVLFAGCSEKDEPEVEPDNGETVTPENPDDQEEPGTSDNEDDQDESETPDGPETSDDGSVWLDAAGTSNCYLLSEEGYYSFDATVMGNGAEVLALDAPKTLAGTQAKLVWQSVKNLVSEVELVDGRLYFAFAGSGNALLAVCDDSGEILWSWHIWYPEATVEDLPVSTGYEVMNLNLGAMNCTVADIGSYGLLYQWGRKDPFPNSPTLTGDATTMGVPLYDADGEEVSITYSNWFSTTDNNLEFAIANPTCCLSNYMQYSTSRDWLVTSNDALWGNSTGDQKDENNDFANKGSKSYYDPCPVGYRVPPADVFSTFTTTGGYSWSIDDFNVADLNGDGQITEDDYSYGWVFNLTDSVTSYFPAATRYDGSYAMLMGSMAGLWGNYWGNAPYSESVSGDGYAFAVLATDSENVTVSAYAGGGRADAYSVRCIKE